jgi:hypothetical protein
MPGLLSGATWSNARPQYVRAQAVGIEAPVRTRAIALYTLYQLIKGF